MEDKKLSISSMLPTSYSKIYSTLNSQPNKNTSDLEFCIQKLEQKYQENKNLEHQNYQLKKENEKIKAENKLLKQILKYPKFKKTKSFQVKLHKKQVKQHILHSPITTKTCSNISTPENTSPPPNFDKRDLTNSALIQSKPSNKLSIAALFQQPPQTSTLNLHKT